MNTNINFAGIKMKNPVTVASGTFGYGREYSNFIDLNQLGGIITKGTSLKPRSGNKPPRVCETASGMLNSIGLQNPGVEYFAEYDLPFLRKFDTAIIVNACGSSIDEYVELCKILNKLDIDGVELNLSCPNVKAGCMSFGNTYDGVKQVTSEVRKVLDKPLIVKLTPNVTDISSIAKAVENAGADGVSLINTLLGMKIDINKRKPVLANNTGGLSGPAIKPIAVRMVYQVAQAVNIPILGMGGIINSDDAIEFILAGASAVSIGSGNFVAPYASIKTLSGIEDYMQKFDIKNINELYSKDKINQQNKKFNYNSLFCCLHLTILTVSNILPCNLSEYFYLCAIISFATSISSSISSTDKSFISIKFCIQSFSPFKYLFIYSCYT